MVVDQNFPKVKKYFLLIFFLLNFSNSHSENYSYNKIAQLNEPWGSSFINKDQIIVTEKDGKIKIVNINSNEILDVKHNLNYLNV